LEKKYRRIEGRLKILLTFTEDFPLRFQCVSSLLLNNTTKVKVKFTLEQAMKDQRGSKWGWVVNARPRPLYPGNNPVPIVEEAG
jgi:hypothetical protein